MIKRNGTSLSLVQICTLTFRGGSFRYKTPDRRALLLASIGVPLALDLVRKIIGKGMQTQPPPLPPPRTRRSPGIPKGKGMQIQPPPFYGTWEDYYRLKKTEI